MEVKPAKCVRLPGVIKDQIIEVPDPERLKSPARSNGLGHQSDREETDFVVQRGRSIPTLASVHSHRSISPLSDLGQKEKLNQDTKSEERGETETPSLTRSNSSYQGAAGRPSEPRSLPSRSRSRRNSVSENFESQISIENIGGSTENLSVLGRNPDKEMKVHSGRRNEAVVGSLRRGSANQQTFDIRKLSDENPDNDVKMFIDNKDLDAMEKHEREGSPYGGKSSQYVNLNASKEKQEERREERDRKTSFADLRRKSQTQNLFATSGINITYCDGEEKEDTPKRHNSSIRRESGEVRSWASPPAQTAPPNTGPVPDEMNHKLNSVRVKLEERRKRIEEEKRKMELVMNRQREKGGGGGSAYNSPDTSASALQSSWLSDRNKSGQMTDSPQSQIQRMMQSSGGGQSPYLQSPPAQQQVPVNPMDPQPFYISGDSPHQLPPH